VGAVADPHPFYCWLRRLGYDPPRSHAPGVGCHAFDSTVTFEENEWYVYTPAGGSPDTGLIIYPGGRVDPRSYAPLAHDIASRGYMTVIVPMPLNLAVFAPAVLHR